MADARFLVKIVATGEVRDADGNLLSTPEFVGEQEMTEAELRAAGLEPPTPEE